MKGIQWTHPLCLLHYQVNSVIVLNDFFFTFDQNQKSYIFTFIFKGSKVPKENLNPEEKRKRVQKLAFLQEINQRFFPNQGGKIPPGHQMAGTSVGGQTQEMTAPQSFPVGQIPARWQMILPPGLTTPSQTVAFLPPNVKRPLGGMRSAPPPGFPHKPFTPYEFNGPSGPPPPPGPTAMENFTDLFGDDLTGLDGLGTFGTNNANPGAVAPGQPGGGGGPQPPVLQNVTGHSDTNLPISSTTVCMKKSSSMAPSLTNIGGLKLTESANKKATGTTTATPMDQVDKWTMTEINGNFSISLYFRFSNVLNFSKRMLK